jgi:2-desacetyl-2-hydroxyethyl bacteriochlorophyllide A dehydrogenase
MKAAFLFGPRDVRIVDKEPLPLRPEDIRVEVAYSGICGTELHLYGGMVYGQASTEPQALGHEFSGRVIEVGSEVTTLRLGDRVTAIPGGPCYQCELCRIGKPSMCPNRVSLRSGAWAPTIALPARIAWRLPDNVSDRAAALTEPLACAIRAVDRSEMRVGDRVCVVGAGPIGLFVVAMAKAAGASTLIVSEPRAARRELARGLGADIVVDPTSEDLDAVVRDATRGMGAEVVFEAVGHPVTIEQAIAQAAPMGTVVVIGVADRDAMASFKPQELFFKELTIRGTKGVTYGIDRALRWLGTIDLEPVITHTLPLEQAREAVELALTGEAGKVYLTPSASPGS